MAMSSKLEIQHPQCPSSCSRQSDCQEPSERNRVESIEPRKERMVEKTILFVQ